jgi:hypothetical protein
MRINLASLDQSSALARRISDAMRREAADAAQRLASKLDESTTGVNLTRRGNSEARGGIGSQNDKRPPQRKSKSATRESVSPFPVDPRKECDIHRDIVAMIATEAKPGVIAFHVPNGGWRKLTEAKRLKAQGVLPGIPDLIVLFECRSFGLEVKTAKGSLSGSQKLMRQRFARAGIEFEVARSVAEARHHLRSWGMI